MRTHFLVCHRARLRRLVVAALVLLVVSIAHGGERASVPIKLQADIFSKLVSYDRKLEGRAGGHLNVLIAVKADSPESRRAASQMQDALSSRSTIAGYPHTELLTNYTNGPALAAECRGKKVSMLFITPGFDDDVETIRDALVGVDVLSAAAVPSYVPRGIVVGIDLVESKPKMLVNLTQAQKQNVSLHSDVLKMMTVYQ